MALLEDQRYGRASGDVPPALLEAVLLEHRDALNETGWVYCGYTPVNSVTGVNRATDDVSALVDNGFRLTPTLPFESRPVVVTAGLRTSRFAPIVFWEILHVLAPGGLWIDVDDTSRCEGTPLIHQDFLQREYFSTCLNTESRRVHGSFVVQTFRKGAPTPLTAHIDDTGWSFGILTSGDSARGAEMAAAILALDLPNVEVVFCGPRPFDAPKDDRVRSIDLDRAEPRGWITRKKNLLAETSRYDNLCLLHDRFVITPAWAAALRDCGPSFSFLTFPQVFFADTDRRFGQRYADYQVLHQSSGVPQALESTIFAGERVWYAAYDDFYETAFCCGGLYVAKRCLWNRVRQDESLYHCEWEDASFGLECQKRGMPHRVSRQLTVESVTPHPMALTRIHDMSAPDTPRLGHLHVTAEQASAAASVPGDFKPILAVERAAYYHRIVNRFNAIDGLDAAHRLGEHDVAGCCGLADVWRIVEGRILDLPLRTRDDIAKVLFFLSDTIYNWPNCEIQTWIAANERTRQKVSALDDIERVVGWGTGSQFKSAHRRIGRDLAFVVDNRPSAWGSVVEGVAVRPPQALLDFAPERTAVIVFSCFVEEITASVRALGSFAVVPADCLLPERRFHPLTDMVQHFEEIERYYPAIFSKPRLEAAA